jgi:hypothetical protein
MKLKRKLYVDGRVKIAMVLMAYNGIDNQEKSNHQME